MDDVILKLMGRPDVKVRAAVRCLLAVDHGEAALNYVSMQLMGHADVKVGAAAR